MWDLGVPNDIIHEGDGEKEEVRNERERERETKILVTTSPSQVHVNTRLDQGCGQSKEHNLGFPCECRGSLTWTTSCLLPPRL